MYADIIYKLKFDNATGCYTIIESGFKYEFPQSLYTGFKDYILYYDLVSRWYKQLNDEERGMVSRSNAYN
jgi:hypothetical protein